ncbi:MAG: CSLREA domain-containing protein [Chloroflexi bacterium]|nr:CSLREA domain-containing protein [Chloroflexota bacterium]
MVRSALLLILAFLALALGSSPQPALAATFVVSKTADTNDGVCNADCSLREAITAANATAAADTITFNATVFNPGTITLTADLPSITEDLDIQGPGADLARVSGAGAFRIFAIAASTMVTIRGLTINQGLAPNGGGVVSRGQLTLVEVAIRGNEATNGGGLYVDNVPGSSAAVVDSTFSGNEGVGGAIYAIGPIYVYNSTIANNMSPGDGGAALMNSNSDFVHTTFSGNSAVGSGGGVRVTGGVVSFVSSILSGNTAATGPDVSGTIWSYGNNVIGSSAGVIINMHTGYASRVDFTDAAATPLNLGPLANNGGPTQTMALGAGSVAINIGDPAPADPGDPALTDQRGSGFPRTVSTFPDAGAYEFSAAPCPAFPTTIAAGDVNGLRFAITCANANGPGTDDVIDLTESVYTLNNAGVYLLIDVSATVILMPFLGLPEIAPVPLAGKLTLHGNGATIERGAGIFEDFALIQVGDGGNLTFDALTLRNGSIGAVLNFGKLTISQSTISDNSVDTTAQLKVAAAAGISNAGILTISDSTISNNVATGDTAPFTAAGGINNVGPNSEATLFRTLVSGNVANGPGGGIANAGTLTLVNSTLSGNAASTDPSPTNTGGGLFNQGTAHLVNVTVAGNTAVLGGGLATADGALNLYNTLVGDNLNGDCVILAGTVTARTSLLESPGALACNIPNGGTSANVVGFDPQLGPLADNGGISWTHALLDGSLAINSGDNTSLDEATLALDFNGDGDQTDTLDTDQRGAGYPRILNPAVDMGAYESGGASIVVTVTLEGRSNPAPHPSYAIVVRATVRPQGGGAPILNEEFVTDQNGVFTIPNLNPGTVQLTIKGAHTLARQFDHVVVAPTSSVTTQVLFEGDATGDNTVNISDFSILAAAFGTSEGQANYNAAADFNEDNAVTIGDFSLLASNFTKVGEGGIMPTGG